MGNQTSELEERKAICDKFNSCNKDKLYKKLSKIHEKKSKKIKKYKYPSKQN